MRYAVNTNAGQAQTDGSTYSRDAEFEQLASKPLAQKRKAYPILVWE